MAFQQKRTFLDIVKDGMLGLNQGLPNCFNKFNTILHNTQRGTYYAVGGLPGSGKSTFVDDNFVLTPYLELLLTQPDKLKEVNWNYYSFEMSKNAKRAKWTAYLLNKFYGLNVDSSYILGQGKNRITEEIYEKVVAINEMMDALFDKIRFTQDVLNPTGINKDIFKRALENGTLDKEKYVDTNGLEAERITGYTPNNPQDYWIIIIDHVALAKKEQGFDTKSNIDKLSEYAIGWRNLFNATPVPIVQFNKGIASIERRKFDKNELSPTLEDFKDTGNIGQDCNVALGVFNPIKYNITEYLDYDIGQMPNSFRSIHIMKNRDGQEYYSKGMYFRGDIGRLTELPDAGEFSAGFKDYKDFQIPPPSVHAPALVDLAKQAFVIN
jgi:hypothetical protein